MANGFSPLDAILGEEDEELNPLLAQLALGRSNPLQDIGAIIASLGGPIGSRVAEGLRFQSARSQNAIRNMAALEAIKKSRQRRGLVDELVTLASGQAPQPLDQVAQDAAAQEGQVLPSSVPIANLPASLQKSTQNRLQGVLAALAPDAFVNQLGKTGNTAIRQVKRSAD
jgi:hypothetical protein